MSIRPLTLWLCLTLLAGGMAAKAAEPAAAQKQEEPTRYIFIIDNSSVLKGELETIRKTVAYLIYNGFYGKMKRGDPFEIWTFNDTVKTQLVPVQYWTLELSNMLASQNYEILKALRFEKTARMDRLMETLQLAISRVDSMVIFLISAGEEVVVGSPVDPKINAAYGYRYEDLLKAKKPFLTTLVTRRGKFTGWAVTAGDERVELNPIEYPAESTAAPEPEKTAAKQAPVPQVAKNDGPPPSPTPVTPVKPTPRTDTPRPQATAEISKSPPAPPPPATTTPTVETSKISQTPPKPVTDVAVKPEIKPAPRPEITPAQIETKIVKVEDPIPKAPPPAPEPARQPAPVAATPRPEPVIPRETPKPIETPVKIEAATGPVVQPKVIESRPIRTDPEVKPQAPVITPPVDPPRSAAQMAVPSARTDSKTTAAQDSKSIDTTISQQRSDPATKPASAPVINPPVAKAVAAKEPPPRTAPVATSVATTANQPSVSPILIAGVALLALAGWIGMVLFRRSRPAAPSFISRSMGDEE